jgi:hypothetical protein
MMSNTDSTTKGVNQGARGVNEGAREVNQGEGWTVHVSYKTPAVLLIVKSSKRLVGDIKKKTST